MRIGWLRGAALVLAVVLGLSSGLAGARILDDLGETPAQDPLNLSADLVNQGCSGGNIIVVGKGETRPTLRAAVVANPEARYLDTDASCPALYAPLEEPPPKYVVYLGPFTTPGAACELRMTPDHKGDFVTALSPGKQTYVKCPCELPTTDWPVLTPDMGDPDTLEGMWINQLQGMLVDLGRLTEDVDESGRYDETTQAAVRGIQTSAVEVADAVVDAPTWELIARRACQSYDY